MHAHPNCSMFLHDFLTLVQDRMLIIDSKERDSCESIGRQLKEMLKKCRRDVAYAVEPCPRCDRSTPVPDSNRLIMTPEAERMVQENLPRHSDVLLQAPTVPDTGAIKPKGPRPSRIPKPRARAR